MAKIKNYKNSKDFAQKGLKIPDYDIWLIEQKNLLIKNIISIRKKRGISQEELAEMLGTTQSVISRIECAATRNITLDYLMRIALVLKIVPNIKLKEVA